MVKIAILGSGKDKNARIVQDLELGTYYVKVEHFRATGTGRYSIFVRRKH